ncbi:hypothetical protein MZO42_15460 [Sphingomonas psychrotolerans]|uniref:Uncharacterized protein n=1 Tax=Sphingomonas psychrotolerans TaxID=1327635 RepID=A0ABU3N8H1_9SPHN|nr:hypothetical protein [Sphingomonas psychrotolerans]MDT8760097.1 hypothetical protein [Sphingomonas psychrotolerans]
MIGKAIAGWLGHRIDASDGEGGTLGALTGVALWEVGKRVVPAALVLGGIAYAVHRFSRTETTA